LCTKLLISTPNLTAPPHFFFVVFADAAAQSAEEEDKAFYRYTKESQEHGLDSMQDGQVGGGRVEVLALALLLRLVIL